MINILIIIALIILLGSIQELALWNEKLEIKIDIITEQLKEVKNERE